MKNTSPLGLNWMVATHEHYAAPSGYEYAPCTYHKANRDAVGIDRTAKGADYTEQYSEPFRSMYASVDTCPDLLKLFFHRLRYDYVMADGRTLVRRIYDDRFEGYEETKVMAETLGWQAGPSLAWPRGGAGTHAAPAEQCPRVARCLPPKRCGRRQRTQNLRVIKSGGNAAFFPFPCYNSRAFPLQFH